MDYFTRESRERGFSGTDNQGFLVSTRLNRTAISLEGRPLAFKRGGQKSIISEGILPGTVQIPGDGLPIITLCERTIGDTRGRVWSPGLTGTSLLIEAKRQGNIQADKP